MQSMPKRGDVQTDADRSRWIVTTVERDGPRASVGRVREGSLAARVIFGAPTTSHAPPAR